MSLPAKTSWNAGKAIGPKTEFSKAQIQALEAILVRNQNWHDLALLGVAVDTMLRAGDLLVLKVEDVAYGSGTLRRGIRRRQQKTSVAVFPVLSQATQAHLSKWIEVSEKRQTHFLFTRNKGKDAQPITRGHYAALIKRWAGWLNLPAEEYSTHSLRRSKAVLMFEKGEPIELISLLLGHTSVVATISYLGLNQKKAASASLRHGILRGPEVKTKRVIVRPEPRRDSG